MFEVAQRGELVGVVAPDEDRDHVFGGVGVDAAAVGQRHVVDVRPAVADQREYPPVGGADLGVCTVGDDYQWSNLGRVELGGVLDADRGYARSIRSQGPPILGGSFR